MGFFTFRRKEAPLRLEFANVQHIGKREEQQDSFGISDVSGLLEQDRQGVLAVVADGMGGLSAGAEISALVTASVLEQFRAEMRRGLPESPPGKLLGQLCLAASEKVQRYLEDREEGGSTLLMALVREKRLSFLSVGDSRIYLWRNKGLILLNREHTFETYLEIRSACGESGCMEESEISQRYALTSYLGAGTVNMVDILQEPLRLLPGDRILLATDGIFRTLNERELTDIVALPAKRAAVRLERAVLEKKRAAQDNFTAVLITCG